MERALNFKKNIAKYINDLVKLPNADRIVAQYERGLITLHEAMRCLEDNQTELMAAENKANSEGGLFVYGMRLRPVGIGCQPKDGFVQRYEAEDLGFLRENEIARYHDVIAYSRKLSEEETRHFSLDYLGAMVA